METFHKMNECDEYNVQRPKATRNWRNYLCKWSDVKYASLKVKGHKVTSSVTFSNVISALLTSSGICTNEWEENINEQKNTLNECKVLYLWDGQAHKHIALLTS